MILSIEFQAELFRDMFLIGVICGFVYDLIRLLRANIKHSRWIMCIEDVFYWAGVIMSAYMFMLSENSGQVRIFVMLAFFGGMLLSSAIVSLFAAFLPENPRNARTTQPTRIQENEFH